MRPKRSVLNIHNS